MSLALIASGAACGTFLDLGDSSGEGGAATPAEVTLDAADFPEGSTVLDDGGVLLPDGAVVDGTAADSAKDAPAADQLVPPVPVCPGDADCERVVFVTSQPVTLANAERAAATCTELAVTATSTRVKGRQFDAWISTAASPAGARLVHGKKPYKNSLGTVIAQNWNDLTDGALAAPLFHDENGDSVGAPKRAWTATSATGTFAGPNCSDWTMTTETATTGSIAGVGDQWTVFAVDSCATPAHLYCVEK